MVEMDVQYLSSVALLMSSVALHTSLRRHQRIVVASIK
jgi:hypothetical protein